MKTTLKIIVFAALLGIFMVSCRPSRPACPAYQSQATSIVSAICETLTSIIK